ncbi:FAD-dependent oxidoreductase [Bacillota bacterium LX-D]|nr:FAD-dependent oxidoreductase [Bacillota bacterium LX-D]
MKKPVLVLGGGIAGIQASLDLAEMGVPVFLVEEGPSIGGRMAQLDKTFPTNDCSACILAPKVTSCYNHPLVKTFTWSELTEIQGEAPNFKAIVRKKARFVNEDKCIGCNACTTKCPIDAKSEFEMGIGTRHAVYKPYAQAVPNKVVIDKKGTSPCSINCPIYLNAHGMVSLTAKGRMEEALQLARQITPFVAVLGQVCDGSCESNCYRQHVDEAIDISSVEKLLVLNEKQQGKTPKLPVAKEQKDESIAVIGAGPAGLNCAYQLALKGYNVTVLETESQPGRMLNSEISGKNLDKELLGYELQLIESLGVDIRCGQSLKNDLSPSQLTEQGYKAIFVAMSKDELEKLSGLDQPNVFIFEEVESVIENIAQGNKVAKQIINFLTGDDLPLEKEMLPQVPVSKVNLKQKTSPSLLKDKLNSFNQLKVDEISEILQKEAGRCLNCAGCSECRACERVCAPKAIWHEQRDEMVELSVSSVILASGYETVKNIPVEWGYGAFPNVVTSLEYERILCASGPFQGHVQRPSDGKPPVRIAFIQCVGSRDHQCERDYCSAVCCMYAVKEAVITKEHLPSVQDIDIYYMDMRAYGKDFERYIENAKEKYGIGFIRSRVAEVAEDKQTSDMILKYTDEEGRLSTAQYDLVVLSVGMEGNKDILPVLEKTGVKTDGAGFCWINEVNPPGTTVDGIFSCGVLAGPKDIPETVIEASAAASAAAQLAGANEVERQQYENYFKQPPEPVLQDVSREPLRIGVFVCSCGTNIGGYVDVKAVAQYAKTLPFVEYTKDNIYSCSLDTQKAMADRIKKNKLNRVVVASCTPRTHERLFQEVLASAGLNPYLLTMANIREQCSWVHMNNPDLATEKAKDLVRMAVGKVTYAKPLSKQKISVTKSGLVIGGGIAGMTAALEIAGMGYPVTIVERNSQLGGNALWKFKTAKGRRISSLLQKLQSRIANNSNIRVLLNSEIVSIDGYVGNFKTLIKSGDLEHEINHGVIVVATGAGNYSTSDYLYGQHPMVITQKELEELATSGELENYLAEHHIKNVSMIQCVGSREPEHPYCSRVCCNQALNNSLMLKEKDPELNISVLYRDIRSYGENELQYRKVRKAGVQFIRFEAESKPKVEKTEDGLTITVQEPLLDQELKLNVDLIVLSTATVPNVEENRRLAQMLKVPLNQDGFFLEAHAKLRPVDFATEGVYVCGLAHAPKSMKESMTQGKAAAARAATVIAKDYLETEGTIAQVDEAYCTGCGTCVKVCAYGAINVEEIVKRNGTIKKAVVNSALCKGCGTCAATCRCGAVDINGFSDRQVLSEVESFLKLS